MIVNGQASEECPRVKKYSVQNGYTLLQRFECATTLAAQAKWLEGIFKGYTTTWTEGAVQVVEWDIAGDPSTPQESVVPSDNWELSVQSTQFELLNADHPLVNALNKTNRDEFRRYSQDPSAYVREGSSFTHVEVGSGPGDNSFNAVNYLWTLYQAGVRHVEVRHPVVKLNRWVGPAYTTLFNVSNVGKLYTTATMISESGIPTSFLVPINNLTAQFHDPNREDGLRLKYCWLKDNPTLSQSIGSKTQIQQTYTFGLYDVVLYKFEVL